MKKGSGRSMPRQKTAIIFFGRLTFSPTADPNSRANTPPVPLNPATLKFPAQLNETISTPPS